MRDKIAFICQRYGSDVCGGSEVHCRFLAERMGAVYDVSVYTTCSIDDVTWKNEYNPGKEHINGITIYRFPVIRERNIDFFRTLDYILCPDTVHSDEDEDLWIDEQGPECPQLITQLKADYEKYKAVIFMNYVYYTTARGIINGFNNAFLIPTLHDEPYAYLRYYDKVFSAAKGIIWNSDAERKFAEKRFPQTKVIPGVVAGVGMDFSQKKSTDLPMQLKHIQYIVYTGRITEPKGCGRLFNYFREYKRTHNTELKLVIMGKNIMPIPEDTDIIYLGFVPDDVKLTVMENAVLLVLFSQFESLSMVVLESMMLGRPVVVNGKCAVLKDHCIRSRAGLYFYDYNGFEYAIDYMLNNPDEYEKMCKNGIEYVKNNYQWDDIVFKIKNLIDDVTSL